MITGQIVLVFYCLKVNAIVANLILKRGSVSEKPVRSHIHFSVLSDRPTGDTAPLLAILPLTVSDLPRRVYLNK